MKKELEELEKEERHSNKKQKAVYVVASIVVLGFLLALFIAISSFSKPVEQNIEEIPNSQLLNARTQQVVDTISISETIETFTGDYEIVRQDGNESLYNVTFTTWYNKTGETIDPGFGVIEHFDRITNISFTIPTAGKLYNKTIYNESGSPTKDESYMYSAPNTIPLTKDAKPELLAKTSAKGIDNFQITANPKTDFLIHFGLNSIDIQQTSLIDEELLLVNVTAETNYTHLQINNISAPFDDLIFYYPFDINDSQLPTASDNRTYDFSENNNDGRVTVQQTGEEHLVWNQSQEGNPFGGSYKFGGLNSYINTTVNFNFDNFSMSVWFRAEQTPANPMLLAAFSGTGNRPFQIQLGAADLVQVAMNDEDNDQMLVNPTAPTTTTDTWNHIVFAFNQSNGVSGANGTIYWNGVQLESDNSSIFGDPQDTPQAILIGARQLTNIAQEFNGSIDEVMWFNKTLSSVEAIAIYDNSSARFALEGLQTQEQFNYTATDGSGDTGDNTVNFSIAGYDCDIANLGSNCSVSIGTFNYSLDDYNTTDFAGFDELILYMNFDNQSSLGENDSHFVDRTKFSNNGTGEGGVQVNTTNAVFGNAVSFDGSNDFVNITDSDLFSFTDGLGTDKPFSISTWIRMYGFSTAQVLISKYTDNTADEYEFIWSGDVLFLEIGDGDTTGTIARGAPFTSGDYLDEWVHVTGTYSGNENESGLKIYLDGERADDQTSNQGSYTGMTNTTSPVRLGVRFVSGALQLPFEGTLDEVMIFNRTLEAEEIKELFIEGRALFNFTEEQNITDFNSTTSLNTFNITSNSTNLIARVKMLASRNQFYSPIIGDGINSFTSFWKGWFRAIVSNNIAPEITIVQPPTNNTDFATNNITVNYTVSDNNNQLNTCFYTNSSGEFNFTITCGANLTTLQWDEGLNTVRIYADDTAGNINSTSVNFTVTLPPIPPTPSCSQIIDTNKEFILDDGEIGGLQLCFNSVQK